MRLHRCYVCGCRIARVCGTWRHLRGHVPAGGAPWHRPVPEDRRSDPDRPDRKDNPR